MDTASYVVWFLVSADQATNYTSDGHKHPAHSALGALTQLTDHAVLAPELLDRPDGVHVLGACRGSATTVLMANTSDTARTVAVELDGSLVT